MTNRGRNHATVSAINSASSWSSGLAVAGSSAAGTRNSIGSVQGPSSPTGSGWPIVCLSGSCATACSPYPDGRHWTLAAVDIKRPDVVSAGTSDFRKERGR